MPNGRPVTAGETAAQRAAAVRAAFARSAFGLPPVRLPTAVGPVVLRPHQRVAAARLRHLLATHGGALLADAVGLGKTWTALAVAQDARAPLVVAPAALRAMWRNAAATAGLHLPFFSTESLSAPRPPTLPAADLLVVDEAHHFRTLGTRRRARLTAAARGVPTLLLSATPVHNATRDLTALLALFLGDPQALALDAATLAQLVVRRRHRDVRRGASHEGTPRFPHVAPATWYRVRSAHAVFDALRAIPPPLPTADGGDAPALATLTLVRLWASSDAALRAGLRRRLTRAEALAHALAAGRHLDSHALSAYASGDDALQLPLFVDGAAASDLAALARHLSAHAAATRHALGALDASPPSDRARHAWLRAVRARHPDRRVVAFTQFADTARSVYRTLVPDGHVGLLTAAGGRIASGPIARAHLLARFAPRATGACVPPAAERIDLLIATDCLSEGLDLQDAGVVVHLDVPWTPARLAQRVGRAARYGSLHGVVYVYGLRPDPAVEGWLRLARRLRTKSRAGRGALGDATRPATPAAGAPRASPNGIHADAHAPAPNAAPDGSSHAAPGAPPGARALARRAANARRLERWVTAAEATTAGPDVEAPTADERSPLHIPSGGPIVAAVRCAHAGFVAVCDLDGRGRPVVVAALGGRGPADAPGLVARALRTLHAADHVFGPATCERANPTPQVDAATYAAAHRAVLRWARRRLARRAVGHRPAPALAGLGSSAAPAEPPAVRATITRAHAAFRVAPPHERAHHAARAAALYATETGAQREAPRVTALVLLVP